MKGALLPITLLSVSLGVAMAGVPGGWTPQDAKDPKYQVRRLFH